MGYTRIADDALALSQQMLSLAERNPDHDEDEVILLEGLIRDSAYKIRTAAERLKGIIPRR